jgi:hypothetical protein
MAKPEYHPDVCIQVIFEMKEGASLLQACKRMGLSIRTINKWAAENPEFQEALELAEESSQAWWLNEAQKAIRERDKSFPSSTFALVMKNRFGWADKQETRVDANLSLADVLTNIGALTTPAQDDPLFDMPDVDNTQDANVVRH